MDLNVAQTQAVTSVNNQVVIIAGPGTGKTKTLVAKLIDLLINQKISSSKIVALTFTKKAANEMKLRLASEAKLAKSKLPFIGTFHSFAYQMLPKNNLKLIDEKNQLKLIKKILSKYQFKLKPQTALLKITQFKNQTKKPQTKIDKQLWSVYEAMLKQLSLQDYDDLLLNLWCYLHKVTLPIKYLLIDEFQDTNLLQYQIIRELAINLKQLVVVGDPKQAIYTFRGSSPKIFELFSKDFPNSQIVKLTTNYRSGQLILNLAAGLFDQDNLELIAEQKLTTVTQLIQVTNEYLEADFIINTIEQLMGGFDLNQIRPNSSGYQFKFSDFAVIYRTHRLNKILKQKFFHSGIPYQVIGHDNLFLSAEIQLLIKILTFFALKQKIIDISSELINIVDIDYIDEDDQKLLINQAIKFLSEINEFSLPNLLNRLIDYLGWQNKFQVKAEILLNLQSFVGLTYQFPTIQFLEKFLNYLAQLADFEYYDLTANKVTLLTLHAAKGLEFGVVFIPGFEQGLMPLANALASVESLAEEKRLFYVGLTRAKTHLYLLKSQFRFGRKTEISQFASLLDKQYLINVTDNNFDHMIKNKTSHQSHQLKLF